MSTVPVQLAPLQLSTLAFNRASPIFLRQATTLQQGYQQALTSQQAAAPELRATVSGSGVYAGADGKNYLVPAARLANRPNLKRTPQIALTPDGANWKIQVSFELYRPAGVNASAIPLLMDSYTVAIVSGDGSPGFTFTTVTPFSPPDSSSDVVGLLRAEGAIPGALVLNLLTKEQHSTFNVAGSLSYRYTFTRTITPPPVPKPTPVQPHPIGYPGMHPLMVQEPLAAQHNAIGFQNKVIATQPITQTVVEGMTATVPLASIPSYFDPVSMDNKAIYSLIMGTGSDGTVWSQQTGLGYSRPASESDGYYVLPDSYRMTLDSNSGLPAMSLLLVETPATTPGDSATYTVRVRLGIGPLLDAARLEAMRTSLQNSQIIPYPQLAVGGYNSATFVLSALFSALPGFQSSVLAGSPSAGIDAANGFELVLDCSLEFYSLMAKLLSSSDGLQGSVQFTIVIAHDDTKTPPDTTLLVDVPVIISFLGPFPLKLSPQIAPADPAVRSVTSIAATIANPLPVPLTVSGIYPMLLTTDAGLDQTFGATPLKPSDDKLTFAPSEQKTVTLTNPAGGPLPSYTSLAIDFGPSTPTFDPAVVLNHYQDVVATAGLHASAHFNCYLLKHPDQIPPSFANLIGMQLEVQHADGVVVGVPLTRDTPAMDVAIPYSFAELLGGASLSQPSFRYRAKSIYPDHAGAFSDWISQTGGIVEVTPV